MTLGELIDALDAIEPATQIEFDFGYMQPTKLDSWRGNYFELALGYETTTFPHNEPTVGSLLAICRDALGKTFMGWKGGDYLSSRDSEVWVDNRGEYSETLLVGVGRRWGSAILMTEKNDVEKLTA